MPKLDEIVSKKDIFIEKKIVRNDADQIALHAVSVIHGLTHNSKMKMKSFCLENFHVF